MQSKLVKLHGYWRSSATYRCRIALNLKKIQYQTIPVNLLKGENKSQEYIKINPQMSVPTLIIDDTVMSESTAIIQYIDETRKGDVMLLPQDPKLKFQSRRIAQIINSGIQPVQNLPVLQAVEAMGGDKIEWARKTIRKGFNTIESIIKTTKGKFCVGDVISMADIFLVPQVYNANRFSINLKEEFPLIQEVYSNLIEVKAVADADPKNQPDASE